MKRLISTAICGLFLYGSAASAQDVVSQFARESTSTKPVFAVFDVRPNTVDPTAIQDAVAAAFRIHYDQIKVNQTVVTYPLPAAPPRMNFSQRSSWAGTVSVPTCPGASSLILGSDKSMAGYGEFTAIQSCIFPYRDGVRVNVYAIFGQLSGGPNPNVLGAMLGRLFTNAVGLGDSSKFIDKTIDDIDQRLHSLAPSVALVELQPTRDGKVVVTDPAETTKAVIAGQASGQQQIRGEVVVQTQGNAIPKAQPGQGQPSPAIAARKELTGMGLTYYSQDQFIEAVKRNDLIACELFLQAGGIDLRAPDKSGTTVMNASRSQEMFGLLNTYASVRP